MFDNDSRIYWVTYEIPPLRAIYQARIVTDGKLSRKQLLAKMVDKDLISSPDRIKIKKVRSERID